jgi:hypothetical protein
LQHNLSSHRCHDAATLAGLADTTAGANETAPPR